MIDVPAALGDCRVLVVVITWCQLLDGVDGAAVLACIL